MTTSPSPPTAQTVLQRRRRDRRHRLDPRRLQHRRRASDTDLFDNYYIAGNRSYVSYDKYLKTGPYFFGYPNTRPDYVDHYAYQEGLLISYWDTSQADNNTHAHPGEGRNLYIDAHPRPIYNLTGNPWRARVQVYDAPFSLQQGGLVHPAHQQPAAVHPWPGRAAAVRRHQAVLVRGAAEPRRQAPGDRRQDQGTGAERHLDQGPHLLIH